MTKTLPTTAPTALLAAALLVLPGQADAATEAFDGLQHGELVYGNVDGKTLYRHDFDGFKLNVENNHDVTIGNRSYDVDAGVIFDTNARKTEDPDLQSPFDRGNIMHEDLGNILIIQETRVDSCLDIIGLAGLANNPPIIGSPDDEGRRPAGHFTFIFDQPVSSFGFDLIDVENVTDENGAALFFETPKGVDQRLSFKKLAKMDTSIVFGNNSANRIQPIIAADYGLTSFTKVKIKLGGSGGIDNIRYTPTAIPTPAAAVTGLALLGGMLLRRRNRKA